jgi:hypothetical protein
MIRVATLESKGVVTRVDLLRHFLSKKVRLVLERTTQYDIPYIRYSFTSELQNGQFRALEKLQRAYC